MNFGFAQTVLTPELCNVFITETLNDLNHEIVEMVQDKRLNAYTTDSLNVELRDLNEVLSSRVAVPNPDNPDDPYDLIDITLKLKIDSNALLSGFLLGYEYKSKGSTEIVLSAIAPILQYKRKLWKKGYDTLSVPLFWVKMKDLNAGILRGNKSYASLLSLRTSMLDFKRKAMTDSWPLTEENKHLNVTVNSAMAFQDFGQNEAAILARYLSSCIQDKLAEKQLGVVFFKDVSLTNKYINFREELRDSSAHTIIDDSSPKGYRHEWYYWPFELRYARDLAFFDTPKDVILRLENQHSRWGLDGLSKNASKPGIFFKLEDLKGILSDIEIGVLLAIIKSQR